MKKIPQISLVGAGPGDPELITIKALKALEVADVVMYDALSNPVFLDFAPDGAEKIFVGKRSGKSSFQQIEINRMMVKLAFAHGHVVRLKGGDPFIFGRGYEEVTYARTFGIEPLIVPGISSATALAANQGVPLTSRGYSEGFWVITGTTRSGQLSTDIKLAARSKSTVVILMGVKKLPEITQLFKEKGKGNMPVMVIQSGSLPEEKTAIGTINNIVKKVEDQEIGTPGVIIVGQTVGLHSLYPQSLQSFVEKNNHIIHAISNRV